ncbi:MAG: CfrBI family restriction endonuclease [Actinomycetia bacterium]|nr:CfrBI family restriction endonuclease [Actinomycetes bacterium]
MAAPARPALSARAAKLVNASGADFLAELDEAEVREILLQVLVGENVRESTEHLTRMKIQIVAADIFRLLLDGQRLDSGFVESLTGHAVELRKDSHLPKDIKWLQNWVLGLTDKGVQNILRDDADALQRFATDLVESNASVAEELNEQYGVPGLQLVDLDGQVVPVDWALLVQAVTMIASAGLTLRGSDKSKFGKLFEKLVLGSLLTILGFRQVDVGEADSPEMVFWLSERAAKRESDATLIFEEGRGIRFDIGFIGRGNPEIILDKCTRFENDPALAGVEYEMTTIIICDRIGKNSKIIKQARAIGADVVQMCDAYWPYQVAQAIQHRFPEYDHDILHCKSDKCGEVLADYLDCLRIDELLRFVSESDEGEAEE